MSQAQSILEHLKAGNAITDLEALNLFRCRRLAARIYDLKQAGHAIEAKSIPTPGGAWVARYRMKRDGGQ